MEKIATVQAQAYEGSETQEEMYAKISHHVAKYCGTGVVTNHKKFARL